MRTKNRFLQYQKKNEYIFLYTKMERGLDELMTFLTRYNELDKLEQQQQQQQQQTSPLILTAQSPAPTRTSFPYQITENDDIESLRTNPRVLAEYFVIDNSSNPNFEILMRRSGSIIRSTNLPSIMFEEEMIISRINDNQRRRMRQESINANHLRSVRNDDSEDERNAQLLRIFNVDDVDDVSDLYE